MSAQCEVTAKRAAGAPLGFFERWLTLWVFLAIIVGVAIGQIAPGPVHVLGNMEIAQVNIPVGLLIWLMIIPMLMKIDFAALGQVKQHWRGIGVTLFVNWGVKPFSMALLAWLFIRTLFADYLPAEQIDSYIAGLIILAAAPCTAMVFVWSYLSDGDAGYTVVQVAVNDLVILVAFAPIVAFLLKVGKVSVPMDTLFLSVVLFVVIPLGFGAITRSVLIKRRGKDWFDGVFVKKFDGITEAGLLLTLVILFSFQGKTILRNPLEIVLIAVPLIIQTYLIFAIGYGWAKLWKIPYEIAAPAGMIGASNFFELSVAVAISLFGLSSGAALATVVGVLTEVPVMLTLVRIARATRNRFPRALKAV